MFLLVDVSHIHLLLKGLDSAFGLVADPEDSKLLVRIILLFVDLLAFGLVGDHLVRRLRRYISSVELFGPWIDFNLSIV